MIFILSVANKIPVSPPTHPECALKSESTLANEHLHPTTSHACANAYIIWTQIHISASPPYLYESLCGKKKSNLLDQIFKKPFLHFNLIPFCLTCTYDHLILQVVLYYSLLIICQSDTPFSLLGYFMIKLACKNRCAHKQHSLLTTGGDVTFHEPSLMWLLAHQSLLKLEK